MISAFLILLVAAFLGVSVVGLPQRNISITVPDGFSNHGKADLFCLPITWYQIVLFFAINYGSHATTIRSRPGQTQYHTARDIVVALLFPFSGVLRAIESFSRCSWLSENDLLKAARAGALCIVVRNTEWRPIHDTQISEQRPKQLKAGVLSTQGLPKDNDLEAQSEGKNDKDAATENMVSDDTCRGQVAEGTDPRLSIEMPLKLDTEGHNSSSETAFLPAEAHRSYRHIHGMCKLPRGYSLTWLSSNAKIISDVTDKPGEIELCSSYNIPKAIVAIVQTIFASITLYRTRGDQIQRYGYAAFGLTVLPYLIMSIMNLFATLILPDYSKLYVVHSLELDEAMTVGAQVEGAIGRIVQSSTDNDRFLQGMKDQSRVTRSCHPTDGYDPERSVTEITSDEITIESSLFETEILSVTHAHSKEKVFCYKPIPFDTLGIARWNRNRQSTGILLVPCVLGAIPLIVIGILTHFDRGKSTTGQRVWTLSWLVGGIWSGPAFDVLYDKGNIDLKALEKAKISEDIGRSKQNRSKAFVLISSFGNVLLARIDYMTVAFLVYTIPAIGGFVIVGQMLRAYGECNEVSGLVT